MGGEWFKPRGGEPYETITPADTRDVVGIFQRSDKHDIDDAVSPAGQAFERWRLVPAPRAAENIYRAGQILLQRKEEYARPFTRALSKSLKEKIRLVQEAID